MSGYPYYSSAFDDAAQEARCYLQGGLDMYDQASRRDLARKLVRHFGYSYHTADSIIDDLLRQGVLRWVDYGILSLSR